MRKKGYISINSLIIAAILAFLAFKIVVPADVWTSDSGKWKYTPCYMKNNNICNVLNQEAYYSKLYPTTDDGTAINYYGKYNIDYNSSYCTVNLNFMPIGAPGDACNGVVCSATAQAKLIKTKYGPVCDASSVNWREHISPEPCCSAQTWNWVKRFQNGATASFHIIEQTNQQNNITYTEQPQHKFFLSNIINKITNAFNKFFGWLFGG